MKDLSEIWEEPINPADLGALYLEVMGRVDRVVILTYRNGSLLPEIKSFGEHGRELPTEKRNV